VRWEAAKALSQIANPASIQALLEALSDKTFEVRWMAAEGLIRIGRKAVIPLLEALVEHSDSYWLREGIHHVLHDMNRGRLTRYWGRFWWPWKTLCHRWKHLLRHGELWGGCFEKDLVHIKTSQLEIQALLKREHVNSGHKSD